jgi:cell division protein FtsB
LALRGSFVESRRRALPSEPQNLINRSCGVFAVSTSIEPVLTAGWGRSVWSGAVSLFFWTLLLLAAACLAAVMLAPRLLQRDRLQAKYAVQQLQLVSLEQQTERLAMMRHALEHDPQFAAEVARLDLEAVRHGEEVITVDPSSRLLPRSSLPTLMQPVVPSSRWTAWLVVLSENRLARRSLLVAAAVLVVVAFTWVHHWDPRPSGADATTGPQQ